MRIMFTPETKNHGFLFALSYAIKAIGEEVILWSHRVSAFDAFDVDKPDILFMTNANLTKEILLALNKHPEIRPVLYSSSLPQTMTMNCPPALVITPPGMPQHVKDNISYENMLEAKYAADLVNYTKGYYMDKASSDLLVLVDRTTVLNSMILQQINGILALNDMSVKCIGYRINSPLYLGQMGPEHTSCFMKSTKLAICYSYEMIPNCVVNRTFCLTPHEQPWVPQFTDDTGLLEGIERFLETDKQKRNITKKAAKQMLDKETYFHRLAEIGELLDLPEWSDKAMEILPRFII